MDKNILLCRFEELKSRMPFEYLYNIIFTLFRDAIINESLLPGCILKDYDIAKLLGISRTPINKAFEMLEKERILTYENGVYKVAAMDYDMLKEIMELRETVETSLIHSAAKNASNHDINQLYLSLQEFKHAEMMHGKEGYMSAVLKAENSFHGKICNMCCNRFLRCIWEQNKAQIFRSIYFINRYYSSAPHSADHSHYQIHAHLYYCVKARDGRMAMDAAYSHLRSVDLKSINF